MIEVKELVPWLSLALALVSIALPYITGRSREVDRKIDSKADALQVGALAGKLDLVEDRVTIVESDLKHLPDKETTHRLEMSLGDLRSEVRGLSEKMKPIAAIADRVQDAVMEKVMGK